MTLKQHSSNASSRNIEEPSVITPQAKSKEELTPKQQFEIFLKSQPLKDGKRVLWMKLGHNKFIKVDATDLDNLKGWYTKGNRRDRKETRSVGKNVFKFITDWSKENDGGVFALYNRPDEYPLSECVTQSNDIGIELDHLRTEEQLDLYRQFTEVTDIDFALILSSGGKSIHAHIKADKFLPVEQIQYLQRLAVIAFQSDPVTSRLHQPMRMPGFYRREEKAYQELISHSDKEYSPDQLIEGFSKWFDQMGRVFPESIPDDWWREEFQRIYHSGSEYDTAGKSNATGAALAEGHKSWAERKRSEREAKELERDHKRKDLQGTLTDCLIKAVDTVNALATPDNFDGVDWKFSESGHARGQCPFHDGYSGNSAWLSDRDGSLKFHCTSCTSDEPRDLFEYKHALADKIDISNPKLPKGKQWTEEARQFLEDQGYEWKPPTQDELINEAATKQGGNPDKPRIDIYQGQLDNCAKGVLSKLSDEDDLNRLYSRGDGDAAHLVRIHKPIADSRNRYIAVEKANPAIGIIDSEVLRHELNKRYNFRRHIIRTVQGQKYWEDRPVDCPSDLCSHITAAGRWSQLQQLTGISSIPIPTKTGEVIFNPGYHPGTGMLLIFDPADFPEPKPKVSHEDALTALETLKDLLKEFAFKLNEGETTERNTALSGALSLLLTAIWRKTLKLAPLHAVSATVAGSGKGTLISVASILLTGNNNSGVVPYSADGEEFRKKVTALLSEGSPIINLDNVESRLGGAILEMCLTATHFKDRILGVSKMANVSTQALWVTNGNNLQFTTDMVRRTILIELDPKVEKPEERKFSRDIEEYTLQNRGKLVDTALTVVRAYIQAKYPDKPKRIGSFGDWSDIIRGSLLWLGECDPVASQAEVSNRDEARNQLASLLLCWHEAFGNTALRLKDVIQGVNAGVHNFRDETDNLDNSAAAFSAEPEDDDSPAQDNDDQQNLKEALEDVCFDRKSRELSSRWLGLYLRKNKGRVIDGLRFEHCGENRNHTALWRVESV